jgi:hypothetical protein
VHVNVRSTGVGRVGVCSLCVSDSEECECGVSAGVNDTILSETLVV